MSDRRSFLQVDSPCGKNVTGFTKRSNKLFPGFPGNLVCRLQTKLSVHGAFTSTRPFLQPVLKEVGASLALGVAVQRGLKIYR